MKTLAIALIKVYQLCISPLIGETCRFTPSCSNYAVAALRIHGFWRGSWLTIKRLGRCNAWFEGGKDEVPTKDELG